MDLRKLAAILRRRPHISPLLKDLCEEVFAHIACDGMRLDLTDEKGGMWCRIVRRGEEPVRPELGQVSRLKTNETFEVSESDGVHQVVAPLGFGDHAHGRWTLRKRSGPFTAPEMDAIKAIADLFSVALRARPFDPPGKSMRFGEESQLV
jgi:hypothetical protein